MRPISFASKMIGIVSVAFLAAAVMVLALFHTQARRAMDRSQGAVYAEKISTILASLDRQVDRLDARGLRASEEEEYKAAILGTLRHTYYEHPGQRIYPFILDHEGKVVMHPSLPIGDASLQAERHVQAMLRVKYGDLEHETPDGEAMWTIFRAFPEWGWYVGYSLPLEIKYADTRPLRNSLALTMAIIGAVALIALAAFITATTRAIIRLTRASEAIASGDLDHPVRTDRRDELGSLARSFDLMRGQIRQKIQSLSEMNRQLEEEAHERRAAEERIRESELAMRSMLDATPYCVLLVGADKVIRYANEATLKLTGYERQDQLLGRLCHEALCPAEENKCPILDLGQQLDRTERNAMTRDGILVPIIKSAVPINISGENMLLEAFVDISELKRAQQELQGALGEKEALLSEIHHRVKNNMAVISSLLNLQSKRAREEGDRQMFMDSISRIKSMALVHEKLYRAADFTDVDFSQYLESLINEILGAFGISGERLAVGVDMDSGMKLSIDIAVPLGLLINELLTNAIKHAFPDGVGGRIEVYIRNLDDNAANLVVRDSGIGVPEGVDLRAPDTLGLQLAVSLASQLGGELTLKRGRGSEFSMDFKKSGYDKRI